MSFLSVERFEFRFPELLCTEPNHQMMTGTSDFIPSQSIYYESLRGHLTICRLLFSATDSVVLGPKQKKSNYQVKVKQANDKPTRFSSYSISWFHSTEESYHFKSPQHLFQHNRAEVSDLETGTA